MAASGQAALEALSLKRFDLVLCDVMMPEMSGIALYHAIARDYPGREKQVIFMSGGVFFSEESNQQPRLPNLLIEKPIDAATLHDVLRRAAAGESFLQPA